MNEIKGNATEALGSSRDGAGGFCWHGHARKEVGGGRRTVPSLHDEFFHEIISPEASSIKSLC